LAITDKKNYSAEDGIDGTIDLFRRNSGYSTEQKFRGIPFRTIPRKRKRERVDEGGGNRLFCFGIGLPAELGMPSE